MTLNINKLTKLTNKIVKLYELNSEDKIILNLRKICGDYQLNTNSGFLYSKRKKDFYSKLIRVEIDLNIIDYKNKNIVTSKMMNLCGHLNYLIAILYLIKYSDIFYNEDIGIIFEYGEETLSASKNIIKTLKQNKIKSEKIYTFHLTDSLYPRYISISKKNPPLSKAVCFQIKTNFNYSGHINEIKKNYLSNVVTIISNIEEKFTNTNCKVISTNIFQIGNSNVVGEYVITFWIRIKKGLISLKYIEIWNYILKQNLKCKIVSFTTNFSNSLKIRKDIINKLKIQKNLIILDHETLFSSDDFADYKSISNELCYIFLGSRLEKENEFHKLNTKFDLRHTIIFINRIQKIMGE